MSILRTQAPICWKIAAFSVFTLGAVIAPGVASGQTPVEVRQEFDMESVRVTDPYLEKLFTVDVDYLLRLDPARLVEGFRAVSEGRDPSTATGLRLYGGWEGAWSLLRGHTLGHYLTALAQAYKQTRGTNGTLNERVKTRLDSMIVELQTFQKRNGNGYLFASPEVHFDVVEGKASGDMWVPWYTMHKLLAGLVDVHELTGSEPALDVAASLGDWIYGRTSSWNAALRTRVLGVEYGGMNDCLYELYRFTNDANHLAAAHTFDEDSLFTPISQGNDVLAGLHANTQIPKFVGALNRYRTLGAAESFYFGAAEQFWTMVTQEHSYVTGGNSENEHFRAAGQLDSTRNDINNETCNAYNMLKLTRDLYKVTGDVKYADFYERAFYNEILSAINPETGMTAYFKPMGTGYFKLFGQETETFWCCNGTGMENYTKLNDGIYFRDSTDVYVNLYVSSTLDWSARSFALAQTADIPRSPTVTFSIAAAPTDELGIHFRKPDWLGPDRVATIRVNGDPSCVQAEGGYFEVSRVWKAGDTVELTLPAKVGVSRLPDNENAVAFTYGPIVLSAGLGTQQMVSTSHLASAKATVPAGVTIKDSIAVDGSTTIEDFVADIEKNLVQTQGELEFALRNTDGDALKFTPQYLRYEDRYGIYFRLTGEQGTTRAAGGMPGEIWSDCTAGAAGAGGAGGAANGGMPNAGGSAGAQGGAIATGGVGGLVASGGVGGAAGNSAGASSGGISVGAAGKGGGPTGGATTGGGAVAGSAARGGGADPGGSPSTVAGAASQSDASSADSGCGCRVAGQRNSSAALAGVALLLILQLRRRRREPRINQMNPIALRTSRPSGTSRAAGRTPA